MMIENLTMGAQAPDLLLPAGFLCRMQDLLGEEYADFIASYDRPRRPSLRVNPLKISPSGISETATVCELQDPVPWEVTGRYCGAEARPGRTVLHEAGAFYIQEASAMLPASIAEPCPGEFVLDLCAAPGGKSTQTAGKLNGEGLLVSNEIHPERARILARNLERMGVRNAIVTGESPERLAARFPAFFDLVMVDAPCSGEGMFRKEPQAAADWSGETVRMCADRQHRILEEAARMTAPGGRLVYSTCTFAPEEDEEAVLHFLRNHPDFHLVMPRLLREGCPGLSPGLPRGDGQEKELCRCMVRIWPSRAEGEGHFAALLVRDGGKEKKAGTRGLSGTDKSALKGAAAKGKGMKGTAPRGSSALTRQQARQLWKEFAMQTLSEECSLREDAGADPDRLLLYGEELYLQPMSLNLEGLKVLRPGLHLGTVRKGRLIPAHALAMALKPEEAVRIFSFEAEGAAARAWLRGESLPAGEQAEGWKGWILVCAGDVSMGWGRCDGRTVKNHYPKGLRRG